MAAKIWMILFLILCSIICSCSAAYNSIRFTRNETPIILQIEDKIENKKFKPNAVFIHSNDTIIQLEDIQFNVLDNGENSISGKIISLDSNYIRSYNVMKHYKRDRMNEMEIPGPKAIYFKQTHIFADSLILSENLVNIQENHVKQATVYYRSRVLHYLLFGVGIVFALLVLLIISAISSSPYLG